VPPSILKRDFWVYVWRVGLPSGGYAHYVGMTGDTGSARAQSAANRVAAHLGFGIANALRKYVHKRTQSDLEQCLEDCRSLNLFASGPVYAKPTDADYQNMRGKVAALEKRLWERMEASGYDMLNGKPQATAMVDENRWNDVYTAFQRHFADLR
jgi:hypothetical protein